MDHLVVSDALRHKFTRYSDQLPPRVHNCTRPVKSHSVDSHFVAVALDPLRNSHLVPVYILNKLFSDVGGRPFVMSHEIDVLPASIEISLPLCLEMCSHPVVFFLLLLLLFTLAITVILVIVVKVLQLARDCPLFHHFSVLFTGFSRFKSFPYLFLLFVFSF